MLATTRAAFLLAASIVAVTAPAMAQEINIYSSRHYDTDDGLYRKFTEATGIKVNRIEGEADELMARIKAEGANSPADILLTVDAGRVWKARTEDLFQAVPSTTLSERIPAHLRDPDGYWFGLSERARLIFYAKDRVSEPPQTYEALADPAYKGKICIRSATNIYNLSMMSAIIARAPEDGDTEQLKGLVSGACDIAVVNTYYFSRALSETVEGLTGSTDGIGWVFPNQETTGTHVNVAAAGGVKTAPNKDNAIKFLEYLTTSEAQSYFADQNNEFPVVPGVPVGKVAAALSDFRRDTLNLNALGENQAKAQEIFNAVGFP